MLSEEVKNEIIKLYEKGLSKNRIAKRLRISWDSVNRVLKNRSRDAENVREESRGIENIREEFERFSRIAEYESELEAMKRDIRAKENDSKNIKLNALEKKVDWAIKNKDYINEEVMDMIRGEFREIIGIPPKEEFEEMLMHYKEIRRFEGEKGKSIDYMIRFVRDNWDLIQDVKDLRDEKERLTYKKERVEKEVYELERKKGTIEELISKNESLDRAFRTEVYSLENAKGEAYKKGYYDGYNAILQRLVLIQIANSDFETLYRVYKSLYE